jgi:hypothetical protein
MFSFGDNTDAEGMNNGGRLDDKKMDPREKWNILMKDLNNEKQRNHALYSSFLPRHSAAILNQGQMPKGGRYINTGRKIMCNSFLWIFTVSKSCNWCFSFSNT